MRDFAGFGIGGGGEDEEEGYDWQEGRGEGV